VQDLQIRRRMKRNIACALIGEIGALAQHIEDDYLTMLRTDLQPRTDRRNSRYRHFRGDRDYMPVFRSLGSNVGYLPTPLPRDLVSWYTRLAAGLERAHELYELAMQKDPEQMGYAIELAQIQHAAFTELVTASKPLLERLSGL
jgi:hypothetical protein